VTTTLSTCGFGDISAMQGSAVESGVILILQFIGMLFYSMTIEKVQSLMAKDEVHSSEYANYMVEVLENFIFKVGRMLPADTSIPGVAISEWKLFALKYFQHSPNSFIIDSDFY